MAHSPHRNPNPNPNSNLNRNHNPEQESKPLSPSERARALSFPDIWLKDQALKHVVFKMHLRSLSNSPPRSHPAPNHTSLLSDELLLRIFSKLPISKHVPNSLVCKRWLHLHGRLVQSVKLLDLGFLQSGRVFDRFPNLTDVDLVRACIRTRRNSGVLITRKCLSVPVDSRFSPTSFIEENDVLPSSSIDLGLKLLAEGYPNLRRMAVIGASENGLSNIAEECLSLQELELHCCDDMSLNGISGCKNLQILKLIGYVDGFYNSVISDIGLTILARGCRRLVKLELCGCEGSYDGIKAIGQCCQMLEELTLNDHKMEGGWLAALSYCGNLKTLRLQSCKNIDLSPGPDEHLGSRRTLEELHLQRCQMRDKQSMKALFLVCEGVRAIVLQDCWGLDNDVFSTASICRRVKFLSLEGCSLLTVEGLESVILPWKELQRLRVESCNKIEDSEITPAMASLFSALKELKWRPDSRSLLSSNLAGTGVGKKGGRFFQRAKA